MVINGGGSLPGCEGVGQELELPAFFSFKLLVPLLGVDGPGELTAASCDESHNVLRSLFYDEIRCSRVGVGVTE
jgi:hypothetical protein